MKHLPLLLSLLFLSHTAFSQQSISVDGVQSDRLKTSFPNTSQVIGYWVAPSGEKIQMSNYSIKILPPKEIKKLPRLEVALAPPKGYRFDQGSTKRSTTDFLIFQGSLPLVNSKDEKDTWGAIWTPKRYEPVYYIDPRCEEYGYSFSTNEPIQKADYFSITCEEKRIYFSKQELQTKKIIAEEFSLIESENKSSSTANKLGTFNLDAGRRKIFIFQSVQSVSFLKKVTFTAGIAGTYNSYLQGVNLALPDLATNFITVTGKLSIRVPIYKQKWDVGANLFGTLAELSRDPADTPKARFLGLNLRIGRSFLLPGDNFTFSVNVGLYFWKMMVENLAYGLSDVQGYQMFFVLARSAPGKRSYGGYFKYAPLFPPSGFDPLQNREIAIGGSLQVNSPQAKNKISLTLDVADLGLLYDASTSSSLRTYSLGTQVSF